MIGRGRGLGYYWIQDSSGNWIDCDAASNFFNMDCLTINPFSPPVRGGTGPQPVLPIAQASSGGGGCTSTGGGGASGGAVDCSSFWNALTSPQCTVGGWASSTFALPMTLLAGVLLLLAVRK